VNTANIGKNIRRIKAGLPPGTDVMAVVKADAYGHGAVPVAIAALESGASCLGVALVEEGVTLRRAGIAAPILFLGALFPFQAQDVLRYGITATVASYESASDLSLAAVAQGKKAKVHVKVDTGMGRLGLPPSAIPGFLRRVSRLPGLEVEGIFTHLASAESDPEMTRRQLEVFTGLLEVLEREGFEIPIRHAANSAAALSVPEAVFDIVRVGIAMYGLSPSGTTPPGPDLLPALSFRTRVSYLKLVPEGSTIGYGATYRSSGQEVIATLPVGYADGYPRALSGKGQVLLGGERRPVVGRVCMDQIMVSLPPDAAVEVGDEAVLIGTQGNETIYAEDLARVAGTINYEIVCGLSKRVPRVYVSG
jgi:alanine racemase